MNVVKTMLNPISAAPFWGSEPGVKSIYNNKGCDIKLTAALTGSGGLNHFFYKF